MHFSNFFVALYLETSNLDFVEISCPQVLEHICAVLDDSLRDLVVLSICRASLVLNHSHIVYILGLATQNLILFMLIIRRVMSGCCLMEALLVLLLIQMFL